MFKDLKRPENEIPRPTKKLKCTQEPKNLKLIFRLGHLKRNLPSSNRIALTEKIGFIMN